MSQGSPVMYTAVFLDLLEVEAPLLLLLEAAAFLPRLLPAAMLTGPSSGSLRFFVRLRTGAAGVWRGRDGHRSE